MIYSTLNEAWSKELRVGKIPTDQFYKKTEIIPNMVITDPDLIKYFENIQDPNVFIKSLLTNFPNRQNQNQNQNQNQRNEELDEDDKILWLFVVIFLILFY